MTIIAPPDLQKLAADGFTLLPGVLCEDDVDRLGRHIQATDERRPGNRTLLDRPWCSELGERIRQDTRGKQFLPVDAYAAQCTLFAKTAAKNWLVGLHQDLTIPVARRIESSTCTSWSEKQGEVFVQPPLSVLEQLVAVRLHLDDCTAENGALRVVPGTHRLGKLTSSAAASERDRRGELSVSLRRGDAMVMKPLLLHASSKATNERPRRVLHFVFGPPFLPDGLTWPSPRRRQSTRS